MIDQPKIPVVMNAQDGIFKIGDVDISPFVTRYSLSGDKNGTRLALELSVDHTSMDVDWPVDRVTVPNPADAMTAAEINDIHLALGASETIGDAVVRIRDERARG